jgi:hypothetical protein
MPRIAPKGHGAISQQDLIADDVKANDKRFLDSIEVAVNGFADVVAQNFECICLRDDASSHGTGEPAIFCFFNDEQQLSFHVSKLQFGDVF